MLRAGIGRWPQARVNMALDPKNCWKIQMMKMTVVQWLKLPT